MSDADARLDPASHASDSAPADVDTETFVVCVIDSQVYAIPVQNVRKVLPLPAVTRIPTDAPHVSGVFHHMGQVLPLWDLHTLLAADSPPPDRPFVLVLESDGRVFGVAVEDVDEVVPLSQPRVMPLSQQPPFPIDHIVAGMLVVHETDEADAGTSNPDVDRRVEPGHRVAFSEIVRSALASGRARLAPTVGPGWEAHLIDVARLYAVGTGRPPVDRPEVDDPGRR